MLGRSLASGGRRATGGVKRQRLQQGFVIAQVAVSVVLLTGAGLLTRTMQQLAVVDTGMKPDHVLTMELPHDYTGPQDNPKTIAEYEHIQQQLAAIPGVSRWDLVQRCHFAPAGSRSRSRRRIARLPPASPSHQLNIVRRATIISARREFRCMEGRDFVSTDRAGTNRSW